MCVSLFVAGGLPRLYFDGANGKPAGISLELMRRHHPLVTTSGRLIHGTITIITTSCQQNAQDGIKTFRVLPPVLPFA
jgi:hypothetical protein